MMKTKIQAVKIYNTLPEKFKFLWIHLNEDKLYALFGKEMPYGVLKARDGDPMEWFDAKLTNLKLKRK